MGLGHTFVWFPVEKQPEKVGHFVTALFTPRNLHPSDLFLPMYSPLAILEKQQIRAVRIIFKI